VVLWTWDDKRYDNEGNYGMQHKAVAQLLTGKRGSTLTRSRPIRK